MFGWEIKPETHPEAVDLFAGDGSGGRILFELGWNPEDITHIDKYQTDTPLIEAGSHWFYLDLQALHDSLLANDDLPQEVELLRGRFDLVLAFMGDNLQPDSNTVQRAVSTFFAKENGHIFTY